MKKRIFSLVLSFCLILSLMPAVYAAGGNVTMQTNVTAGVRAGDEFTVTVTFPAVSGTQKAYAIGMQYGYNKDVFTIKSFSAPSYNGTAASASNASDGTVSCTYMGASGANTIDCSAQVQFVATFTVNADATPGDYDFDLNTTATMCKWVKEDGYSEEDLVTVVAGTKTSVTVLKSPISSVTIADLDAPAKGATPDTSVTVTPSGLAADVKWFDGETPVTGSFAASTAYTVKIKLTASGGDNFAATVTAGDYTVTRNSETELLLTKTFDPTPDKTLIGLTVTTPPTKKTYVHGDGFDPAGMVVKAEYDDGTSNNDFKGYVVEYATVGKGYLCKDHTKVTLKKDGKSVEVTGLTVSAKPLTVTGLTAVNREYKPGDKSVTLTGGTLSGVVGSEKVSLVSTPTTGTILDAGVGNDKPVSVTSLSLTGADAGNYTLTQPTEIKVNITPKNISGANITLNTAPTYDGTEKQVTISGVTVDGSTLTMSDYDIAADTDKATNVESKELKITGKGNYGGEARAAWKLQQATPVDGDFDTSGLAASYPYTGSEQNAPIPTTAKTGMGTVTVNYPSSTTPKYVGDYGLTFSVAAGQNYTAAGPFSYGTMKIVAVEDPAVITTTASMPKGGHSLDLRTLVSDDAKGDVTFAIAPGATSATLSGYTLTSTGIPGTVNIYVTIKAKDENGDSKVEYTGKTGTITVNVLNKTTDSSTMKVTQDGCTYGEALPAYVLTGKPTGAGTDTVLYTGTLRNGSTYSSSTAPTEAGSYTVKVECETTTTIYKATSASFTIEPKSISGATVDAITGLTYTGTAHTPAPAVKMNGTALNNATDYTLSYSENTNAGTATMTVTGKGNYNDTKTVNFGIGQATLTITDATIGAKAYDGTKNATVTSVTFSGLQNSETLDMTTDYTVSGVFNSENVNDANTVTVSVTLKDTAKTKNYTLPTATFNKPATITQAATPAAPTGLTGVKGQALSTVSLTAHPGWSWVDNTAVMNTAGNQNFNANYHDANGNYANGTNVPVSVNVLNKTNAGVTINGVPASKTYGDADFTLTASAANMGTGTGAWTWSSSDSSVLSVAGTGANATVTILKAGSATISAKYESNTTMDTKTTASITINKATVTVAAKNQSIYVGGTVPSLTPPVKDTHYTVTGLVGSDTLVGTLAMKYQKAGVDATPTAATTGTYDIVISGVSEPDTTNYNPIVLTKGTLTISNPSHSGGGGGSYTPSYTVSVDKTENGTITVSPKSASKGDTVTITVKPDKGYELEMLKALDKDGDALKLTEKNGKYTFKMPSGKVTVKGSFVEEAPVQIFKDVPVDAYYYEAVKWAAEKGITGGVGNGLFAPNQPCTRAQIVTFLWRAAGSPAPKNMSSFADVPADTFYAKAVAWAVENGITGGTGDGKFSPDATCTRAQSVTFLYRAAGSPKVSSSAEFGDVATNAYYADAVAWAAKNGITGGIGGGLFGSDNDCTRAQIVTFLYRNYQSK